MLNIIDAVVLVIAVIIPLVGFYALMEFATDFVISKFK